MVIQFAVVLNITVYLLLHCGRKWPFYPSGFSDCVLTLWNFCWVWIPKSVFAYLHNVLLNFASGKLFYLYVVSSGPTLLSLLLCIYYHDHHMMKSWHLMLYLTILERIFIVFAHPKLQWFFIELHAYFFLMQCRKFWIVVCSA